MRRGRPPGLAKAPCSRVRSWRIGWTADEFAAGGDLDDVTDDRDLDLAAAVGVADPVVRAGEADVARTSRPCGSRSTDRRGGRGAASTSSASGVASPACSLSGRWRRACVATSTPR